MMSRAYISVLSVLMVLAVGCSSSQSAAPPSPQPAGTSAASAAAPTAASTATKAAQPTIQLATTPTPQPTMKPLPTSTSKAIAWQGQEYSFEQVVTISGQEAQVMKVAIKGQKMRMEFGQGGKSVIMIGNPEQKAAYMLTSGENQALKLPYDQFETQKSQARDPGALSKEALSGQLTGTDTVDGKPCDVYTFSSSLDSSKVWIWKEKGFPLKAELSGSGQSIHIEYRDIKTGGLPDNLFELPPGVQVVDLGSLPDLKNLPSMPAPGR